MISNLSKILMADANRCQLELLKLIASQRSLCARLMFLLPLMEPK